MEINNFGHRRNKFC